MANGSLKNAHIADLHELAAERGIEGFRMLTRDELIEKLGDSEAGSGSDRPSDARTGGGRGGSDRGRSRRGQSDRGGRRRGSDRSSRGDSDREGRGDHEQEAEPEDPGEPITGVLEVTSRGHGFIRPEDPDTEGDIYVSPSQIRRCELQAGDIVSGPARSPRRGERHPALVHIDSVNGAEPGAERSKFEDFEAVPPHRRLPLSGEGADDQAVVLLRSIDLLTPLARGQRVLVNATRGSGRTTLLRILAAELCRADDLEVIVLLIDERPEEERAWRDALPEEAELTIAGAEMRSGEQLRAVELAVAQARRKAEAGGDVALLIDSLSRLAVAADDPGATKPIFGAGRETAEEEAGSLTVIATALTGEDDGGVAKALATTENVTITLSAELAEAGIYPALDVGGCRVGAEDSLREEAELAGARALRAELTAIPAKDAAERLVQRLKAEPSNEKLLASLGS